MRTKEWILHNFPDPDDLGIGENVNTAKIWRYGNIELHFDEQKLALIFSDYIDSLNGGDSLELKKWVLESSQKARLENIIKEFRRSAKNKSPKILRNSFEEQIL